MARTVSCNETRQLTSTGKLNPLVTGFEMHKTQVMCITQGHITPLSCKLRHLTCSVARARVCVCVCVCVYVCVCVCACARARLCDVGCTYSCTAHGLACYCCCTVLAFFFFFFCTARRALVYTRGSRLISTLPLLLSLLSSYLIKMTSMYRNSSERELLNFRTKKKCSHEKHNQKAEEKKKIILPCR